MRDELGYPFMCLGCVVASRSDACIGVVHVDRLKKSRIRQPEIFHVSPRRRRTRSLPNKASPSGASPRLRHHRVATAMDVDEG